MFTVAVRFGMLFGLLDLGVRVFLQSIEWFEAYQALLIPTVLFSICAGVLALITPKARRAAVARGFELGLLGLFIAVVAWAGFQLSLFGALDAMARTRFDDGAVFFLVLIAVLALLLPLLRRFPGLLISGTDRRSRLVDGISDITLISVLSLLCYDIWSLNTVPKSPLRKKDFSAPNILFITLDTVRADHMGFMGYPKSTTPFLDSLAEKAVVFERAYSSSPWTLPAHSSIFTGLGVSEHGAHLAHQKLVPERTTAAELMQQKGYATGGVIAGPYAKGKYGLGQGFDYYSDRLDFFEYIHTQDWLSFQRLLAFFSVHWRHWLFGTDGTRLAPEVVGNARRWVQAQGDRPWFMFVNVFDAHDPYDSAPQWQREFTPDSFAYDPLQHAVNSVFDVVEEKYRWHTMPRREVEYLEALYDSEIRLIDETLRDFFHLLEGAGKLRNTAVIITADHGEEFFEHGGVLHMDTLFEEVLHVPLLIYWPARFAPRRVGQPVSTQWLHDAFLEISEAGQGRLTSDLIELAAGRPVTFRAPRSERMVRSQKFESYQCATHYGDWKRIEVLPPRLRIPEAAFFLEYDAEERRPLPFEALPEEWR